MFDIGFSELFIVLVIALVVLGPERLPGAVRKVGLVLGKIKASWNGIQTEINRELEAEELRKRIQDETNSVQQTLNNSFDIDAYNERILEQERKIREGIQREAIDPSQPVTTESKDPVNKTENNPLTAPDKNLEAAPSSDSAIVQDPNKS